MGGDARAKTDATFSSFSLPSPWWGGGWGWGAGRTVPTAFETTTSLCANGEGRDDRAAPHPLPSTLRVDPHQGEGRRFFFVLAALSILAAPAAAQDSVPMSGEEKYVELCGMCHRANGMGTGLLSRRLPPEQAPLEARDNLTADFVTAVVRNGLLNMPPLSRAEVSEEALAAIAAYLAEGPHTEEPSQ